jgi:lysophospholipase L1-like esterase
VVRYITNDIFADIPHPNQRTTVVRIAALMLAACLAACSAPETTPTPTASPVASLVSPTASSSPSPTSSPTPSEIVSPSPSRATAGTYLALGDSLAVGAGATRPDATGYVARFYRALSAPDAVPRATDLRNLAIGGETSASMIASGQLAAAVDAIGTSEPPVVLVTLDIGGNDLLGLLRTEACAADPLGTECLQLLAQALAEFETNYSHILMELTDALEQRAPDATLSVMTYFNPFSGTDVSLEAAAELALLGTDGRLDCDAEGSEARGMNDIIACVGDEHGAVAVDVQPAFEGLGLELTHIGNEDIHANDRGYEVIADLFVRVLERDLP